MNSLRMLAAWFALAMCWAEPGGSARAVSLAFTPAAISNTYSGPLTLKIGGLSAGQTVVLQEFLDRNHSGVVASSDPLVQQFELTDGQAGMVIGGVTNYNVPGDEDTTAGQITTTLQLPGGNFVQSAVGQYIYVISSPTGAFSQVVQTFEVTNTPFAQKITGKVGVNGTGVAGALVVVFPPPSPTSGLGYPEAATVADGTGAYSVALPPGGYLLIGIAPGYVCNGLLAPQVVLGASQTIATNINLTAATTTITGRLVDSVTATTGLPGLFLPFEQKPGVITAATTDTNGNFSVGVTPGGWKLSGNPDGLALHGYSGYQSETNLNAGSYFSGPFFQGTALFYGRVTDAQGHPLAGIDVNDADFNGMFNNDVFTDTNGGYQTVALGGLAGDNWQVQITTGPNGGSNPTNYVFSQPTLDQNGGFTLSVGQAQLVDFTALPATNLIYGQVTYQGNPVAGVGVYAGVTIGGQNYNAYADTDSNGNYIFNVASGAVWNVGVNCNGGNDSLDTLLGVGNYVCPGSQNVTINTGNVQASFNVQPCGGVQIVDPATTQLPSGQSGVYYSFQFQASSCNNNFNWVQTSGTLPPGLTLYSGGQLNGTPYSPGTYTFGVQVTDGNHASTSETVSLVIAGALQVNTTGLPNATNTLAYSDTLQASGGTPPYTWSIPSYSAQPPTNVTLATNGVLSGVPAVPGGSYYGFYVRVTDSAAAYLDQYLTLNVQNLPLTITNTTLPVAVAGVPYQAQLGVTGGQSPFSWQLGAGSASLPAGLALSSSGLLSGTATSTGPYAFLVQVNDSAMGFQMKPVALNVVARPRLGAPLRPAGGTLQLQLTATPGQNYTLQMTTNLNGAGWTTLYTTNNPSLGSLLLTDPGATNRQRFYRVLLGP